MKLPLRILGIGLFCVCALLYLVHLQFKPSQPSNDPHPASVSQENKQLHADHFGLKRKRGRQRNVNVKVFKMKQPDLHKDTCTFLHKKSSNATYNTLDMIKEIDYTKEVFNTLDMSNNIPGIKPKTFKNPRDKLTVIVMPFSHNDPAWLKTFNEYYEEQTKLILNNMLVKMKEYEDMRFIWSEVILLKRWWTDITAKQQNEVVRLIKSGHLEIVMGGWVVPDEATTTYFALIDQLIEGHQWLKGLGITVNNSVSMDPFGYSTTLPYILSKARIKNAVILRIHEQTKNYLQQRRSLEFIWRQQWASGQHADSDLFTHVMPYILYQISHQCGPDRSSCIFFDFRDVPGDFVQMKPVPIGPDNVEERSRMLAVQYRKKSQLYKHNVILVPLGDDFRYDHEEEWDQQYHNYKALMNHINRDPSFNIKMKFGTVNDYFEEVSKSIHVRKTGLLYKNSKNYFPTLTGDFYTYSDKNYDYWSGYFTTRPFDKALSRRLEEAVRAAEIINSLILWQCANTKQAYTPFRANYQRLQTARQKLALFQHHDAITGTSKPDVVQDLEVKLLVGLVQARQAMLSAVEWLLTGQTNSKLVYNNLKPIETALSFNVDEVMRQHANLKKFIIKKDGLQILVYNPLEQRRQDFVRVTVNVAHLSVLDHDGNNVESQVNPIWNSKFKISDDYELIFLADLPPLSVSVFKVLEGNHDNSALASIEAFGDEHSHSQTNLYANPHQNNLFDITIDNVSKHGKFALENQHIKATFSKLTGMLKSVLMKESGVMVKSELSFSSYEPAASGAYLFRPYNPKPEPLFSKNDSRGDVLAVRLIKGPLVSEVHVFPKNRMVKVHIVKICHVNGLSCSTSLGITTKVNLNIFKLEGKETVMQVTTAVQNNLQFYTDSNNFQMIRRKTFYKMHLGGNYYPMTSTMYIEDVKTRVTLLSAQSLGVASPLSGVMEVMLDRRLLADDNRGLGEGVYDNKITESSFILLFEQKKTRSYLPNKEPKFSQLSLLGHLLSASLNHPTYSFITKGNTELLKKTHSFLLKPFPCDVKLVNIRNLEHGRGSTHLGHAMIIHRLAYDCSLATPRVACSNSKGRFSPSQTFKTWVMGTFTETTLSLMHEIKSHGAKNALKLDPMELYTYLIEM